MRIAKGHDEALHDARAESIAAPLAYVAGVLSVNIC